MLVEKVDPNWYPVENDALEVGDTIEITDPETLIDQGKVSPAKKKVESDNTETKDDSYVCDVCGRSFDSAQGLGAHSRTHN